MVIKILLLIIAFVTGTIFFLPKPQDISGTWVKVMGDENDEAAIIRIQLGEGYYTGKLDLPGQNIYDELVMLSMKNDSIEFMLDKDQNRFIRAAARDSILAGRWVVDGRSENVLFRRYKK